jgi:hypothetical protein
MSRRSWFSSAVAAALALAVAVVAGCSGPRSGVSAITDVSGCAAVLPLAREIVHDEGTLVLVRRISERDALTLSRQLAVPPPPPPARSHHGAHFRWARGTNPCLVVYRGDYPPGSIAGTSPPAAGGHYALLVLRVRHPLAERIWVTDRLPPGLKP